MKVNLNFKFNENTDLKAVFNKLHDIEKASKSTDSHPIEIEVNIDEQTDIASQDSAIEQALNIDKREAVGKMEDATIANTMFIAHTTFRDGTHQVSLFRPDELFGLGKKSRVIKDM